MGAVRIDTPVGGRQQSQSGDRLQDRGARLGFAHLGDPVHYDACRFVESIRAKYWLGMLSAIDAALVAVARRPADRRAVPFHPGSDTEFMRFLMAAREYLLSEGRERPKDTGDEEFRLLRLLCQGLVVQGRFPPERLELFARLDAWPQGTAPGDKERDTR